MLSLASKRAIEKHGKRLFRATRRWRGLLLELGAVARICGLSRYTAALGGGYFKVLGLAARIAKPFSVENLLSGLRLRAPRRRRDLEIAGLFNGLDQCWTEQDVVSRAIVGRSSQTMVDCTCPTSHAMAFGSRPGIGLTADGAA